MFVIKKSILFLINGLGIEKPNSYSISIDQCMPKLARIKETSYFTTSIINSLEPRGAYQDFFIGDSFQKEMKYLEDDVFSLKLEENEVFQNFLNTISSQGKKIHIFLEPTNDRIVELINEFVKRLNLKDQKRVYLHLLLPQQTISDYKNLIGTINFIKFHINPHVSVGFVIGKEYFSDDLSKEELLMARKMLFYSSCERWSETEKKLTILRDENVRPCMVPGFCATTEGLFENGDPIFFFNTRRTTYDKFINILLTCGSEVFRGEEVNLPMFSLIQLDTTYTIPFIRENVTYDSCLSKLLKYTNKKALIITREENFQYLNFLANGLDYVTNADIQFMRLDQGYLDDKNNLSNLIDNSMFDFIIFDYHMDVRQTVNHLKAQLEQIDIVLGMVGEICENKHSLFISSLYGIKKELPLADYNMEMVTIDYEMQIPIFFYDYSYPRSKYTLVPGDTNSILKSCIRVLYDDPKIESLIRPKGLLNNIFGGK